MVQCSAVCVVVEAGVACLEELTQGLDEGEFEVLGQAAHIVV